jgi:UDP-2-acetamido-3-amino-2,3-dideoxy-glucuronate N-acetyltransferase
VVDEGAVLEPGVQVWHFSHVMPAAVIGAGSTLGQNVFVGRGVRIGAGSKIQNNVSVYEGVTVGRGCFIGPSVVFTNVKTPRAEVPRRDAYVETIVEDGATLGANATIVCGVRIGAYAVVGAGAVVTHDVPAHRVVIGVPARAAGWACRCGAILAATAGSDTLGCAECARWYVLDASGDGIVAREGGTEGDAGAGPAGPASADSES